MLVGHWQRISEFPGQTEVFQGPVAEPETSFIAQEIMFLTVGDPANRKLIHKKAEIQVQMPDIP